MLVCPRRRVSGLGSVRLFSFAVGRGGGGMNTGCGERVKNGGEERRKGPPCWSTVTGVIQTKKHAYAQDPERVCSQPI